MATIKFSDFDAGNINAVGAQVVGLAGGNNKIFNVVDLVNGLASTTYVDAQDLNLQNQITQNANDIANIDIDVGNIEVDTSEIEANIAILQGNVTVIEGNIVVLEGAVAALENNVSVNSNDITTIQGNITLIETQIAELEANGNIQTLSLDNSSNVLSISGGNTVNFTTVLGNVAGSGDTDVFGTTISIANTSTDVYNRNGVLPADPKGMAVADPNNKSGWYWISPGPTANPSGLNSFQWKMFNNDGPQTFTVADIDYIYMIVDLYTVGQVYFNVFTAGINPAPTAFQSRFSFTINGDFASTGRFLMWAKPPGSTTTVDDVEVYPFLERLELPYVPGASSGTLLTSEAIKSVNVQTRSNPALTAGEVEFNLKAVGYKVNNNYIQNFDMEIYGGDQSLSLNDSSNVLTISGSAGNNTVDFTNVLGNVAGGGGGNPFDQDLNTTDDVTFNGTTINGNMDVNGAGNHTFQGTIEFTQIANFGGTVGITAILDEDNMVSDSATALATQQSIKTYVDNAVVSGGGYSNAVVTSYAEAGWQGNIIPSANVTYDLGSATNRWKDLFLSGNTIFLGDESISVNANSEVEFTALHITGDVQIDGNVDISGTSNKQENYDIRDYGAVGGNVTLDTAAFEDALEDIVAAGGGVLVIPRISERYIINVPSTGVDNTPAPRNYSNVTIRGGGEIFITQTNAGLVHIGEGTDNFVMEELDILISSAAAGGFGKGTIVSHYGDINKIRIQNLTIKNEFKATTEGGPTLINFTQDLTDPNDTKIATNITVFNCDLESYGRAQYGIRLIRKTKFSKILNNRVTLHGNTLANNQSYNAIAMYGWAEEFLIQGNSVFKSGHSAIACSMAYNGIVKENFVTGVPFNVEGGIEVENKWDHARDNTAHTTSGIKVINNIVTGCNLGIMVTNRNAGGSTNPQPTSLGVENILIDGNSVYDSIESDIIVYDILSGTPVTANVATDIRITNNSCFSTAVDGGIRFYAGTDSAINANHVKGQNIGIQLGRDTNIFVQGQMNLLGNFVENCTVSGIVIESGNSVLRCSENSVANVAAKGVQLTTCQGGTQIYSNNYVEDTGQEGYAVRSGQTVTPGSMFRGNRTFRAGGRGFDVRMDDSIITENISVDNATNDDFRGNVTTIISNNLSNLSS